MYLKPEEVIFSFSSVTFWTGHPICQLAVVLLQLKSCRFAALLVWVTANGLGSAAGRKGWPLVGQVNCE